MIYETEIINGKEFHRVCKSEELENESKKLIEFEDDYDAQMVILRHKGKLNCVSNICPHMKETKMYKGRLKDGTITCPAHGWRFKVENGLNLNKKIGTKDLPCYEVVEKDGYIFVEKPDIPTPKWML